MKREWVCLGLLVAIGCGGDDKLPPTKGGSRLPDDGDASTSLRDSGVEQDASVDGMQNGPRLEFVSPAPATSPNDEEVWVESMITVRCKATPRSTTARVDASSVKISMEKSGTASTQRVMGAVDAQGDEYEARFDVSDMPNGELRFHCEAKDLAATPGTSSITFATLLDLGPTIEITKPEKPAYALKLPVPIEFKVTPAPLADGDDKAAVTQVTLEVSGRDIPVTQAADEPGVYRTDIDFQDRVRFPAILSSAEIVVSASSSRTPVGAIRSAKRVIQIDANGPTIVVEEPTDNSLVRGTALLRMRITDPSGIKSGSVTARFENVKAGAPGEANDDLILDRWEATSPSYVGRFDTGNFASDLNQVTINIEAEDEVGNRATTDHRLYIDNRPPIVSLDPPDIRERRKSSEDWFCSEPFDPVGPDAVGDGGRIESAGIFRALIEDGANRRPDQVSAYYAGVDNDKVVLWAQGDLNQQFLIDTNADGICDEIKTDLLGAAKPTPLQLKPVTVRGTSWFSKVAAAVPGVCTADPSGSDMAPNKLCPATTMFRATSGRGEDRPPAVYGYTPSNTNSGECAGREWLVGNIVGEGWACFAVRAEDRKGNVGISAPIRVCVDDPDNDGVGGPQPCSSEDVDDPGVPTCRHNCQLPPVYESGIIWNL